MKTPAALVERPREVRFRPVALTPRRDDAVVCRTPLSGISAGTGMRARRGQRHPDSRWRPR